MRRFLPGADAAGDPPTLTMQACHGLRQALTTGYLRPGPRLTVRALAEELGMRVTPVREARNPVARIADLARQRGLWLHVDACVGGYLAPFVRRLGYDVPAFDFALPGVCSMSADPHEHAYAAKPASTVLFRDKARARHPLVEFDARPRGTCRSRTFSGSRPAGAVPRFLGKPLPGQGKDTCGTRAR